MLAFIEVCITLQSDDPDRWSKNVFTLVMGGQIMLSEDDEGKEGGTPPAEVLATDDMA